MAHRYELTYHLTSPMRIGHRLVGNLQTTRLFVPGIGVWASTVNRLVRLCPNAFKEQQRHLAWGDYLRAHLRFSSLFFLLPDDNGKKRVLLPGDPEHPEKVAGFAEAFLNSSCHTALFRRKAEEGSLHELEWILPKGRNGQTAEMRGWIECTDASSKGEISLGESGGEPYITAKGKSISLQTLMAKVTAGADLNHGRGRLQLLSLKKTDAASPIYGPDTPVPGWLAADAGVIARGKLEAMAGRTRLPIDLCTGEQKQDSKTRTGGNLYHSLAYQPGARLARETTLNMTWNGTYVVVPENHQPFEMAG